MPFSLPLESNSAHSNSARALDEWLNTDRFLPFAEWIQASSFYTVLLNKAADNPALGAHEAAVYGGHVFAVQTRVHGSNWDIFREYDRRVRQEVAGCRKTSTRMRFDIRSINQPLLILSASAIRGARGETIDMQGVLQSPWGRLFDASYVDRAKIHQSWTAPVQALSQAVIAPSSPKRKAPRINNVSFGNPPAASSSSSQYPAHPIWCPIWCTYTTTHRWKTCNSPASCNSRCY